MLQSIQEKKQASQTADYNGRKFLFRLDANYAVIQIAHWCSFCMLYSFSAVYLTHKGFTDTQIGLTVSLIGLLNIVLQLAVSSFSDSHAAIPLKRIIGALYLASLAFGALMSSLPLAAVPLMLVFVLASSTQNSVSTLLNAMTLQYNNNGVNATYGWPRGAGSVAYAVSRLFRRPARQQIQPGRSALSVHRLRSYSPYGDSDDARPLQACRAGRGGRQKKRRDRKRQHVSKGHAAQKPHPTCLSACGPRQFRRPGGDEYLSNKDSRESGRRTARTLGVCMFLQAIVEFPIMAVSSFLMTKFRARYLLLVSFFCFAIKMFALAHAASLGVVYGAMVFSIFCFGLFAVTMLVFVNRIVGVTEKVRGQAAVSVFGSFGAMIGNAASGRLIDTVGLKAQLDISWVACLFAALLMLLCCAFFNRKYGKKA
jgi:MFS family permease